MVGDIASGAGGAKPATAVQAEPLLVSPQSTILYHLFTYLEAFRVLVAEGIFVGVNTFDPDGCRCEEDARAGVAGLLPSPGKELAVGGGLPT